MDFLQQYLDRARQIIGDRSPSERKYDDEVVKWLRKGKTFRKAIQKAKKKYPKEALKPTDDGIAETKAHYEYLAEHASIVSKLGLEE